MVKCVPVLKGSNPFSKISSTHLRVSGIKEECLVVSDVKSGHVGWFLIVGHFQHERYCVVLSKTQQVHLLSDVLLQAEASTHMQVTVADVVIAAVLGKCPFKFPGI